MSTITTYQIARQPHQPAQQIGVYTATTGAPPDIMPSRNFIYYVGRAYVGAQNNDAGMQMWEAWQVFNTAGFPSEDTWPYNASTLSATPPEAVFAAALKNIVPRYYWLGDLDPALSAPHQWIAAGFPVAFGLDAYANLESAATAASGIVPMPSGNYLGGHAMLALDYDDNLTINGHTGYFWCLNSWGAGWGLGGLCLFPYDYWLAGHTWDHSVVPTPAALDQQQPPAIAPINKPLVPPTTPTRLSRLTGPFAPITGPGFTGPLTISAWVNGSMKSA